MSKRLVLLTILTCAIATQAQAHELAYSKSEEVRVVVPGEANNWCKDTVELTIERPSWESAAPLETLLGKIPFIFKQECPSATVQWKAVDSKGELFAQGAGNSHSLGSVNLVAQAESAPAAKPAAPTQPVTESEAKPAVAPMAQVPALAPTQAAPVAKAETEPKPVAKTEPVATQAAAPAPAQEEIENGEKQAAQPVVAAKEPVPQAATPDELGRKLVRESGKFVEMPDTNGCLWFITTSELRGRAPEGFVVEHDGVKCVDGYAMGPVKKVGLRQKDRRYFDSFRNLHVHPSGLVLPGEQAEKLDQFPVTFITEDLAQVLIKVNNLGEPDMDVLLVFNRGGNWALRNIREQPNVLGVTQDESFAATDESLFAVVQRLHQAAKQILPIKYGQDLAILKDIETYYAPRVWGRNKGTAHMITRGNIRDSDGLLPANQWQSRGNFVVERRIQAERDRIRQLGQEYRWHTVIVEELAGLQEEVKEYGKPEVFYLGRLMDIQVGMPAPVDQMNPRYAASVKQMVVKVGDKEDGYYELDFPAGAHLYVDDELDKGWMMMPVATITSVMDMRDGEIIPSFKGYAGEFLTMCEAEYCTDHVGYRGVMQKRHGSSMPKYDWSQWTVGSSAQAIAEYDLMRQNQAGN